MNLTEDSLTSMLPKNKNIPALLEALEKVLPKYEINTVNRVAGFLAQCGHESIDFTALKENLNYSADRLDKVFPKYFKNAGRDASEYARNPEKIANVVYANRMGNGDTASGDGYKYRGRGAIHLTGKDNYISFAQSIGMSLDEAVDYTETLQGAIESACWYWKSTNLNATCDNDDIVSMTKKINGGTIGLEDRKKHYNKNKSILSVGEVDNTPVSVIQSTPAKLNRVVKFGSKGDLVKKIQAKLGIKVDGIFGKDSVAALKEWQADNGLTPDGIAGKATLGKLFNG